MSEGNGRRDAFSVPHVSILTWLFLRVPYLIREKLTKPRVLLGENTMTTCKLTFSMPAKQYWCQVASSREIARGLFPQHDVSLTQACTKRWVLIDSIYRLSLWMFRCHLVRIVPLWSTTNSMTFPIQRSLLASKNGKWMSIRMEANWQSQLPFTLLPRFEGCLRCYSCCRLFKRLDF